MAAAKLAQSILEQAATPILVLDREGCIVQANASAGQLAGESVLLRSFDDIFELRCSAEKDLTFAEILATTQTSGNIAGVQAIAGMTNGRTVPVIVNAGLLTGPDSGILGCIVTFYDISEVKRTEEALRESEERYKALFDSIQDSFSVGEVIVDAAGTPINWRYLDVNPAFERTFGTPRSEVIGRTHRELFPDESSYYWVRALGQVALSGQPAHLDHYASDRGRHYQAIVYQLEPGRFAAILSDVTERMHAVAELQRMDRIVKLAQKAGQSGVWEWDLATDAMTWSEEHFLLFGLESTASPTLQVWLSLIHEDDQGRVRTRLQELIRDSRTEFTAEFRRITRTGVRWFEVRAQVISSEGRAEKVVGITTDITQRKRLERDLLDSNHDLERFAYVASHDLQEPLRNITAFCQLLERQNRGRLEAESEQFLDIIVGGSRRMSTLISDLLQYSRVASDTSAPAPVDLNRVLETSLDNLKVQIEKSQARIIAEPLPTLSGIESLLVRVFQNLISNAIKYRSQARTPVVQVSAQRVNAEWLFSVVDNGIGFDKEYVKDIFTIFKRLHGAQEYSGAGIGLSIVKRVVERHGGRVFVETEIGQGSTFYFTLPANTTSADDPGPGARTV